MAPALLVSAERKPNVLIIVADDLGYGELGCQGFTQEVPTPHIDSIAKNGVRFTNGYVSGPYCSPTRAGLMTGRYQQRFGHELNPGPAELTPPTVGLPLAEKTMGNRFKAAGYATGWIGKSHLGYAPQFHPLRRGFDEYFGFLGGMHDYLDAAGDIHNPILRDTAPITTLDYTTDAFGREAASFIARHRGDPWLCYLAFNAVHAPLQAIEKYLARFKPIEDPKRRSYAAMESAMDDAVGVVLAKLRELRLEDDTLIFFFSDNGGPTGGTTSGNGPLRGFKSQTWEGGIRVAFMAQWKGRLPAGKVDDRPVIQLGILPTALAAAGVAVQPERKLDGVNLLPFLTGEKSGAPHDVLFWRFGPQLALRKGDWKILKAPAGGGFVGESHDRSLKRRWGPTHDGVLAPTSPVWMLGTTMSTWTRFKAHFFHNADLGVSLDLSRLPIPEGWLATMEPRMQDAFAAMKHLEGGAIANPDEKRMVGHYWLRKPELAPSLDLSNEVVSTLAAIKDFTAKVHAGTVAGPKGKFKNLLVIGIGGSALGPQLVAHALGQPRKDKMAVHFFDNTDPDGIDYVLNSLRGQLAKTLAVVISKSGGTAETRNGQLEAIAAFKAAGLDHAKHFVAVTGVGSKLDDVAKKEGWLARFPMWDWVGGRTSELCAVGLLPAALQGLDIQAMLDGAAAMDEVTRQPVTTQNPAALMALAWHFATDGRGAKDMVVLPYKDRLLLFSRYLQQLVMESLGKEFDLDGKVVNQGIAVYGNKGSTDQHAYVQQLREGVNNFFVTFIEVLKDRDAKASLEVEPGITAGDYLQGFLLGTRDALTEKDRHSITLTLPDVSPRTLGMLIALYERVTGLYASLVGINAYHQPGVEAGKKAAGGVIALKLKLVATLKGAPGESFTAEQLAAKAGAPDKAELAFKILEHLAANKGSGVKKRARTPVVNSTYRAA